MTVPSRRSWLIGNVRDPSDDTKRLLRFVVIILGVAGALLALGWWVRESFWEGVFVGSATTLLFVLFLPFLESMMHRRADVVRGDLMQWLSSELSRLEPIDVVERRVYDALERREGEGAEETARQLLADLADLGLAQTSVSREADRRHIKMEGSLGSGGEQRQVVIWHVVWDQNEVSQWVVVDDVSSQEFTSPISDLYKIHAARESCVRFVDRQLAPRCGFA